MDTGHSLPDISDDCQHHSLQRALSQIFRGTVGGLGLQHVAKDEDDVLDELSARFLQQDLEESSERNIEILTCIGIANCIQCILIFKSHTL